MKVNFSNVEVKDFEPIPNNDYVVNVTGGELRGGDGSKDYINWEFTVAEGDKENRKVWDKTYLTEDALWKLKLLLTAVGIDADGELDFEIDDVIGKKLIITTKQNADKNDKTKIYVNVNKYKAVDDEGADSLLP